MDIFDKKLFFVVNPHSGTMKAGSKLLKMIEILSNGGYSVTVYPTKCRGDGTDVVKYIPDDTDVIVVCGGDGTLNEVITGMMNTGKMFKIGYIPAGTQNEWSSGLKIPRKLVDASKVITEGQLVNLDIGSFNDKYFTYTASFGALTEASYNTPQEVKNVLGQAAYVFEGIKLLGSIKPVHISIEYDDGQIEGDYIFGAITNSLSVGGVIKLKDSIVNLSDGLFEVVLIKDIKNVIDLQAVVSNIIAQKFEDPRIELLHTSHLVIKSCDDIFWTLDGEMANGGKVAEISNLHNAVQFYVPNENISII